MGDNDPRIASILIVGGGTAGWMAAAALSRAFSPLPAPARPVIKLVESDAIGTVGVGEATIPPIRQFNRSIGLDEADFMASTGATPKLGIAFEGWMGDGSRYFHGFGDHGPDVQGQPYRQHLFRLKAAGRLNSLDRWSVPSVMAAAGRFARPEADPRSILSAYSYAYHFDAGLFAGRLSTLAQAAGVTRLEGRISAVDTAEDRVRAVQLEDGRRLEADLFIDCSGFRGLLIEGALKAGYEDWSRWLPCDRAIAIPTRAARPPDLYTTARAASAGWCWRIPLQHRVGNGYVYSSAFIEDDAALDELAAGLEGPAEAEPNRLRFVTGRRRAAWKGNVVALGLASGFLEPLESTSINLIQTGIGRLLELFPDRDFDPVLIAEYNRRTELEWIGVRDFIIAHYHLAARAEGALWAHCRETPPPDSLTERLSLFRARGEIDPTHHDSFREASWTSVLTGLDLWPQKVAPQVGGLDLEAVESQANRVSDLIARATATLPDRLEFLRGVQMKAEAR
ncbi:tryptophan halogenase family protein [Brevundimonas sp. FT23042]|uniref:tryptophan halogenase family protein n=1 Tax=Brevundimonas sp. FT23042 TaxID=3393749 RepID=UPI003B585A9F